MQPQASGSSKRMCISVFVVAAGWLVGSRDLGTGSMRGRGVGQGMLHARRSGAVASVYDSNCFGSDRSKQTVGVDSVTAQA